MEICIMVFCYKCGTENPDNTAYCSRCGAELKEKRTEERGQELGKKIEKWGDDFGKNVEQWGEDFGKTVEDECFKLPHGGAIIGIIIGAFLVIIGASLALGLDFEIWGRWFGTGILIVIGLIIVISAIYGLTRKRS
jgi:ribosomal protein L40E